MPFELTILGSSSALPTSERYPTAQVVNLLGRFFLVDCGEGTQMQLRKQKIGFGKIKHILISHLHGDHFYGLIGLISSMNLLGLRITIHIYSPSELKNLLQPQLDLIKGEMNIQLVFHPLNFKKIQRIFSDRRIEVFSFPVKHSISTCGFLFREKPREANIRKDMIARHNIPIAKIREIKAGADFTGEKGEVIPNEELTVKPLPPRSYAFCTDTAYFEPLIEIVKGVDLLYHEATFPEELGDFARKTLHSTPAEAAEIARKAGVKKLMLGHFSARYPDAALFVEEASLIFPDTIAAEDGKCYQIPKEERS